MSFWHTFWMLLVAHAVTDFPLQGDFLAKAKNHKIGITGMPWYTCLLMHAIISGGGVTLVTGSMWLGLMEMVCHFLIDFYKNDGHYGFNEDQAYHIACKFGWAVVAPLFCLMEAM